MTNLATVYAVIDPTEPAKSQVLGLRTTREQARSLKREAKQAGRDQTLIAKYSEGVVIR